MLSSVTFFFDFGCVSIMQENYLSYARCRNNKTLYHMSACRNFRGGGTFLSKMTPHKDKKDSHTEKSRKRRLLLPPLRAPMLDFLRAPMLDLLRAPMLDLLRAPMLDLLRHPC